MTKFHKISIWVAISAATILILAYVAVNQITYNDTPSFPYGIYWRKDTPIEKGSLVLACPPVSGATSTGLERGWLGVGHCASGTGFVIKKVVAVGGDTVLIAEEGVYVNGNLLPNTASHKADPAGRPMPLENLGITTTLTAAQVLLVSDYNSLSFDGRYWGISKRTEVVSGLLPLCTWE